MTLAQYIEQLRTDAGLSVERLAVAANTTRPTMSRILRGERPPDTDMVPRILDACNATAEQRSDVAAMVLGTVDVGGGE